MAGFVVSLTMVPAAMTLCEIAASPFFAALLGRFMLGERVTKITWGTMVLCAGGLLLFAFDEGGTPVNVQVPADGGAGNMTIAESDSGAENPVLGNVLGTLSSMGFAVYTVTLRVLPLRRKSETAAAAAAAAAATAAAAAPTDNVASAEDTSELTRLYGLIFSMWAAFVISVVALVSMLATRTNPLAMARSTPNVELSAGHGVFIFVGFCMFTAGAGSLPAPELILLTMLEVVGGVLLTWAVLGELPGTPGLIGGWTIVLAVVCNGLGNGLAQKRVSQEKNKNKNKETKIKMANDKEADGEKPEAGRDVEAVVMEEVII